PVRGSGAAMIRRSIKLTIDENSVRVPEGATLLEACRSRGVDVPTICFAENLTPANECRSCVVNLEGARSLVAACSRRADPGMVSGIACVRVALSGRRVVEVLGSSVALSTAREIRACGERYGARPERFGPAAATLAQPVKVDNDLYVRDYGKCVLCYKCV